METVPSKFTVGSIGTPRRGEARRRQADRRGACAGATVDRRTTGGANLEEGRNARNGQYCRVFPQTIDVDGRPEQGTGRARQRQDGSWQIVG